MRRDLTIFLCGLLAGFLIGLQTCKGRPCPEGKKPGQVIKSDTARAVTRDTSTPKEKPRPVQTTPPQMAATPGSKPVIVQVPVPVYLPANVDTLAIIEGAIARYQACGNLNEYAEKFPFGGDTVEVFSAVQYNGLLSQSAALTRSHTTITNTVAQKPRNGLWWGIGGGYAPRDSLAYLGGSLMFLHKRGTAYEAGVKINSRGHLLYEGGVKFLFGRRKRTVL